MRSVSWQQLEYFLVVARTQHISKAAAEIGLSQPALSRAIANLETNLKVPLFRRVGRSIILTRLGSIFRDRVDHALREIENARALLNDLANAEHGTITLGFVRRLGREYLPSMVRGFREAHPEVQFDLNQHNTIELERRLIDGELDLILVPRGSQTFEWAPVKEQELNLIVPHSHPLAGTKEVALAQLRDEKFIALKTGLQVSRAYRGFLQAGRLLAELCFRS